MEEDAKPLRLRRVDPSLACALLFLGIAIYFLIQHRDITSDTEEIADIAVLTISHPVESQISSTSDRPETEPARPLRPPQQHRVTLRSWSGPLVPSVAEVASRFNDSETEPIEIPTFDGASVRISIHHAHRKDDGRISTITGTVANEPGSLVSIAQAGSATAGSILIPSKNLVYEIRPGPDGDTIFSEVDVHALGDCQLCIEATASN